MALVWMDPASAVGRSINESDMLLIPIRRLRSSIRFYEIQTLVMLWERAGPHHPPELQSGPALDCRKAELYMRTAASASPLIWRGSEFFIFDNVRFDQISIRILFHRCDEGRWNSGREMDNLGYRPRYKEVYFRGTAHGSLSGPARQWSRP